MLVHAMVAVDLHIRGELRHGWLDVGGLERGVSLEHRTLRDWLSTPQFILRLGNSCNVTTLAFLIVSERDNKIGRVRASVYVCIVPNISFEQAGLWPLFFACVCPGLKTKVVGQSQGCESYQG